MLAALNTALLARAQMYASVRAFFAAKNVLEVETPIFAHAPGTDPNLANFTIQNFNTTVWGQTSPEFAMKRLLAAGSGSIYQIFKALRKDEIGHKHHFEFALLEYYRVGFTMEALVDECIDLLTTLIDLPSPTHLTYKSLFEQYCGFCPHTISDTDLRAYADQKEYPADMSRMDILDMIYGVQIEPLLENPTVITDYPASVAMLARSEEKEGVLVAKRFEIVYKGMELANGYDELCSSKIILERMQEDNRIRKQKKLPQHPIDMLFVECLDKMPACSGVAIGLDRLLMLKLHTQSIEDVQPFISDMRV